MKEQMKKQISTKLMSWPHFHSSYRIRNSEGNFISLAIFTFFPQINLLS